MPALIGALLQIDEWERESKKACSLEGLGKEADGGGLRAVKDKCSKIRNRNQRLRSAAQCFACKWRIAHLMETICCMYESSVHFRRLLTDALAQTERLPPTPFTEKKAKRHCTFASTSHDPFSTYSIDGGLCANTTDFD